MKFWFEKEDVSADAKAALYSYQKFDEKELAGRVDRAMNKWGKDDLIFPTTKGASRRALESMLYCAESMELQETTQRNEDLDLAVRFERYYKLIEDDEIPNVYIDFRLKMQEKKVSVHGLGEPSSVGEMRDYMTKVHQILLKTKLPVGPIFHNI